MPKLSKRLMNAVRREVRDSGGLPPRFLDLAGNCMTGSDPLASLSNSRRRRAYALQESINRSEPYLYSVAPGIMSWVLGLEDRRMILGSMVGSEVMVPGPHEDGDDTLVHLVRHGLSHEEAEAFVARLEVWSVDQLRETTREIQDLFYTMSGWKPELMEERRRQLLQQQQINEAVDDLRVRGGEALYTFEKERVLISNIRAGDRPEARRILNEMLATIYMSSPRLVVLRARVIELMTCLTRAAIEDNPLMEPLIERNHAWTDQLIRADSFESVSECLMRALDDFIDGIYLHGVNRSNGHVHKALEFISQEYAESIGLREVAAHVGLSSSRMAHLVKAYTGQTVLGIIHQVRIRRAQELLDNTNRSCAEIGYEVGFGDQSYFTYHFKRQTGTTPAKYRRGVE
jgi:AraC-like DNA-binding protein